MVRVGVRLGLASVIVLNPNPIEKPLLQIGTNWAELRSPVRSGLGVDCHTSPFDPKTWCRYSLSQISDSCMTYIFRSRRSSLTLKSLCSSTVSLGLIRNCSGYIGSGTLPACPPFHWNEMGRLFIAFSASTSTVSSCSQVRSGSFQKSFHCLHHSFPYASAPWTAFNYEFIWNLESSIFHVAWQCNEISSMVTDTPPWHTSPGNKTLECTHQWFRGHRRCKFEMNGTYGHTSENYEPNFQTVLQE